MGLSRGIPCPARVSAAGKDRSVSRDSICRENPEPPLFSRPFSRLPDFPDILKEPGLVCVRHEKCLYAGVAGTAGESHRAEFFRTRIAGSIDRVDRGPGRRTPADKIVVIKAVPVLPDRPDGIDPFPDPVNRIIRGNSQLHHTRFLQDSDSLPPWIKVLYWFQRYPFFGQEIQSHHTRLP